MGRKMSRSSGGGGQMSNGGIMGSGIFGMFGSTVVCKSEDDSTYCSIVKAFNMLLIAFFVLSVLYLVYYFFTIVRSGRKSGSSSSFFGGRK